MTPYSYTFNYLCLSRDALQLHFNNYLCLSRDALQLHFNNYLCLSVTPYSYTLITISV